MECPCACQRILEGSEAPYVLGHHEGGRFFTGLVLYDHGCMDAYLDKVTETYGSTAILELEFPNFARREAHAEQNKNGV